MRVRICDLLTGRRVLDLPFITASWTAVLNDAEEVHATVSVRDRTIRRLDLYNAAWPGRTALVVEDDSGIIRGGPLWSRSYNRDEGTVEFVGKGMWSYFDHRTLLPVMKATDRLTTSVGSADQAFDTNLRNMSYETIAKRWIQQSMEWTGGNLPIVFSDDVPGSYERNIKGAELKLVSDLLGDLTEVEHGPDIEFIPRRTSDGLGYEWMLVTGHPRITSETVRKWDMTVPRNPITNLVVDDDASVLSSQCWQTGGASSDQAIIERVADSRLTDKGFPFYEKVESLSSTVVNSSTALAKAVETIRTSQRPTHTWSFSVRKEALSGVQPGYPCAVKTRNDLFGIPDGLHSMRIMSLSGGSESESIDVKAGAVYDG